MSFALKNTAADQAAGLEVDSSDSRSWMVHLSKEREREKFAYVIGRHLRAAQSDSCCCMSPSRNQIRGHCVVGYKETRAAHAKKTTAYAEATVS